MEIQPQQNNFLPQKSPCGHPTLISMAGNNFPSGSDAGNRSDELGGITKTDRGSTPRLGCGIEDEREGENSRDSGTELVVDRSSRRKVRREDHAERYDVALHSDGVSSSTVLGQQLAGEDAASGNVFPTFEPVLGSEVLSSQQRGVIQVTETKVGSGSRSLPFQQFSSPTTKVEMKLSAPLPPESRLEGAFESSASLFEAILDSPGANKELSGVGNQPFESPKRATGKPEDGQPGSNGDHGDRSTPTKTLKMAPEVKLELDRVACTLLGCTGPRQRYDNHLSGASLRTSSQQSGPVEGLENELAGPTSAERRANLSGRAKAKAKAGTKYLSKPPQEPGSSIILTSHNNQSSGSSGHGFGIKGPVATTLHEYNVHHTANDIKRYRIAGLLYPGFEYFSQAPPSGPSPTRPYHRDPGVYPGKREPGFRGSTQDQLQRSPPDVDDSRPRCSTQCQSQSSQPAVAGITISEGVSVPPSSPSPENTASQVPHPFYREVERYRVQSVGRQLNLRRSTQDQSQRFPPTISGFSDSRNGIDALISSLIAENTTSETLPPFYREAASHRRQSHGTQAVERRLCQASDHRLQSRGNQSRFGHDARPQLSTHGVHLSPPQQQPQPQPQPQQQQHPRVGPTSVIQTHLNITGLSIPPATLPAINMSTATSAVLQADNMAPTSVPLLSESYFQQLHMMYTARGQRPHANPPPSQTDNTSSDSPIRHLAGPDQAQTLATRAPRALQFPQGSQSQLAEAPSTQARNASLTPTNPHQVHLNDARALAARVPGAPQSIQRQSSTTHSSVFQIQFTETPSTKARNELSVPSNPRLTPLAEVGALAARISSPLNLALQSAQRRFIQPQHAHSTPIPDSSIPRPAHLKDVQAVLARIPRTPNLPLPSAQAPSTQQQAQKASSSQNTRDAHSSLLLNMANTQPDSPKLQLARSNQIQADVAPVPGAPQSARDPSTQLQPAPNLPFSFPPGGTMPGTSAPYTWHHHGAPPPLSNTPNIKDPITQLSLYERQIAIALSPKVTAFMTENTAVFVPILEANGTIRRMVLQELPALTSKYCDEFCKFFLRLTLMIRSLLQLNLSGYYAEIRIKMVRDLETNGILLFNKMQERILLESERLGEQMERNGAVLSALRPPRPPSPSGDGVEAVAVAVVTADPSTLLQQSSSAPSTVVKLSTGAHEAVTANTSAQQETSTRLPVEVSSPRVRVERPPSRTAEERFAEFQAALARNGVRTSGG